MLTSSCSNSSWADGPSTIISSYSSCTAADSNFLFLGIIGSLHRHPTFGRLLPRLVAVCGRITLKSLLSLHCPINLSRRHLTFFPQSVRHHHDVLPGEKNKMR